MDFLCMYLIQHCFICRPSDSTVSEDAGIEPRTIAASALVVRCSSHSATSQPQTATSHPQERQVADGRGEVRGWARSPIIRPCYKSMNPHERSFLSVLILRRVPYGILYFKCETCIDILGYPSQPAYDIISCTSTTGR